MLSVRSGMLLYAVLTAVALLCLKGPALYLTLVIIGALAIKTYVHYLRERMQ